MQVNVGSMYFMFGGISKLIATVITYPVQVVQTRSRVCCSCVLLHYFALSRVQSIPISVSVSLSLCLFVCLSTSISQKTNVQISPTFLYIYVLNIFEIECSQRFLL